MFLGQNFGLIDLKALWDERVQLLKWEFCWFAQALACVAPMSASKKLLKDGSWRLMDQTKAGTLTLSSIGFAIPIEVFFKDMEQTGTIHQVDQSE